MSRRTIIRFWVALGICVLGARGLQRNAINTRHRLATLPTGTPITSVDSITAAKARRTASHTSYSYHFTTTVIIVALLLGTIDGVSALILFIWPDRDAEPPFQSLVPRDSPE